MGEEASYAFTILPPWYRSGIAYTLYGLMLAFTVVAARRSVVRHEQDKARRGRETLEAQAKVLEATVTERTRELREQSDEIATQKDQIQLLSDIGREMISLSGRRLPKYEVQHLGRDRSMAAKSRQQAMAGAGGVASGPDFEPVAGVSLETYTAVSKGVAAFGYDQSKLVEIAASHGVAAADWETAASGLAARIRNNPAVGQRFNALYRAG